MSDRSYGGSRALLRAAVLIAFVVLAATAAPTSAFASPDMATVTILHGLPGFTADVYVNGKLTLDGFKPETATPALRLPAGDYDIAIRNVGESPDVQPVLHAAVSLGGGINYTIVAHLNGSGDPKVTVFRNDVARMPVGKSRLIVRNVAHTPALTLTLNGDPRFRGLASSEVASALIRPGRYSIEAILAGSTEPVIRDTRIVLGEGTETIVYVVGSNDDGSLDFMSQVIDHLSSDPASIPTGGGGQAAPPPFPAWLLTLMAMGTWLVAWGAIRSTRRVEPAAIGERRVR